jgi:hypothetical protein
MLRRLVSRGSSQIVQLPPPWIECLQSVFTLKYQFCDTVPGPHKIEVTDENYTLSLWEEASSLPAAG